MYAILLFIHSLTRWLVLISLIYGFFSALYSYLGKKPFTAGNNTVRHITATIAHVQLAIGYLLYFKSPVTLFFRQHYHEASQQMYYLFFGIIHIAMMTVAVILITIGSSVAKRQTNDQKKFATLALWFGLALFIILAAIPWPFSPLAARPYLPHL